MQAPITLTPIGVVHNSVDRPVDCPWGDVVSQIALDSDRFSTESLAGIEHFSHIEVVFALHRVPEADLHYSARHPRGRTDWPKVGIFAQRGKDRPNRIGVTTCRLLALRGLELEVQGLDAIDGTPVIDIKPYMAEFAPQGSLRQPAWATELMSTYWLEK